MFRSAIERAGLRLVVDCPPLPEPVYVDREMWEKIVLNLLSNAFKFTFEGEIAVRLRRRRTTRAELTVRDTGTGIPADELPRLFERFHRVEGARGRTHEGTGIGLALVQELVRAARRQQSRSRATRAAARTFTRRRFPFGHAHLPPSGSAPRAARRRPALGASAVRARRRCAGCPAPRVALADRRSMPHRSRRRRRCDAATPARAARVLLADDNADMREYLRRLLAAEYDVEAVADGEAALEAARRSVPTWCSPT